MKRYRITKYNPKNRNDNGVYIVDEWTSISDIGKMYSGLEFTYEEYYDIEKKYIDAIKCLMSLNSISSMKLAAVEKSVSEHCSLTLDERELYNKLSNDVVLGVADILTIVSWSLREWIWVKLFSLDESFIIEFGYDYYMYISCEGMSDECILRIQSNGLYVEELVSG